MHGAIARHVRMHEQRSEFGAETSVEKTCESRGSSKVVGVKSSNLPRARVIAWHKKNIPKPARTDRELLFVLRNARRSFRRTRTAGTTTTRAGTRVASDHARICDRIPRRSRSMEGKRYGRRIAHLRKRERNSRSPMRCHCAKVPRVRRCVNSGGGRGYSSSFVGMNCDASAPGDLSTRREAREPTDHDRRD